ncbi:hypothetical protein GCM10022198_24580 [Klugiella xanthotipulae]
MVGDSYDNALAESVNGYYTAELGWVHWHNTGCLHSYLGDVPSAEFEAVFSAGITSAKELVDIR